MGYLNEDGLATLVGKVKGQVVQLTSAEYRNLPASKNSDNKTYFVTDEDYAYAIDDEPTLNSDNLVKSGGVYTYTSKIGSGTLETTAQTIIPAINELKNGLNIITVTGSDGNAVKFPDGTMIFYGTKNVSLGTAATTQHITFPASFVGAPTITISTGAGGTRTEAYVEDVGTGGFNAYFNARSATSTSWLRYIAMGRWKA